MTPNDFTSTVEYLVTAADSTTATYTVRVVVAGTSDKAITAFSFPSLSIVGTVNETLKTITATVPYDTNVSALKASFDSTGQSVKVGTTPQVSGTTANDFSAPVSYTVTASDASTATYVVTVAIASNSAKAITAFSFAALSVTGTIDESTKTITATVPYGTSATALVATFQTSGASVKVGSALQVSGVSPNNFTSPVTYTVTAADSTTQSYTVTVTASLSSAKAITAFSFATLSVDANISESTKTITATVPYGTSLTVLVASFQSSGASVKIGSVVQSSGVTVNNFTNPVTYTVTAADGTTQDYTVTVTVALNSAKAITSFSFDSLSVTANISEFMKTITATVPYGTSVTALVASFQNSGASVKVGSALQSSGVTPNDFTSQVIYMVTAADGTTQAYTVTVIASSSVAATPTFNPAEGSYTADQSVTISCATAGASIYYTIGTGGLPADPTTASTLYSGAISVAGNGTSTTIKAVAVAVGYAASGVASSNFTISYPAAATPTFNPAGGTFNSVATISLSCETLGASIIFTSDGSEPYITDSGLRQCNGVIYSQPFTIATNVTIKAKAYKTGLAPSEIGSTIITMNPLPTQLIGMVEVQDGYSGYGPGGVPYKDVLLFGKMEVSQNQYLSVIGINPVHAPFINLDKPVTEVSYNDAAMFCNLLSIREGLHVFYQMFDGSVWGYNTDGYGYRLPNETQWIFAAGGGNISANYAYSGSNTINEVAWYSGNSSGTISIGGLKIANELGIFDMSGNVSELIENYGNNGAKGGNFSSSISQCTISAAIETNIPNQGIGFRVVRRK